MKSTIKILITSYLLLTICYLAKAQTNLVINGGHWVNGSNNITLNNTNFINNSTFHSGSGAVIVTGDGTAVQSQISGTSSTTFYNLEVNKSSNNASLGQNITVSNQLTLTSGKLAIGNSNLTMGNSATFSGISPTKYIQTNGTGTLIRQVGNTWVTFPIGRSTLNPARLKNVGVLDNFNVRVVDQILLNGTTGNAITQGVIPRTWFIAEETVGGSDVSMRLVWRPSQAGSGFDPATSQITHYTGGQWQDLGVPTNATDDNTYSSDHKYREATNITSFSPFGAKSNGSNLPVELLYFYGEQQNENVLLDWQTATEINNSHFDVEWSTDGLEFQKIGEVQGNGTTTDVHFYDFLHENPCRDVFIKRHYYRLRQVDLDGTYEYTNTIQVTFEQSNSSTIKIFPNPAAHYLNIESEDLIGETMQFFSINGQLIKEFQHQSLITNLPVTNLPSGTYFIKMGEQVKKVIIKK